MTASYQLSESNIFLLSGDVGRDGHKTSTDLPYETYLKVTKCGGFPKNKNAIFSDYVPKFRLP